MDEIFARALHGVAAELQMLAFESHVDRLYEADLRAASRRALQMHLGVDVVVEAPVPLASWKAKTGRFDLAIAKARSDGYDALAELKLWRTRDKIVEAVWDAWKLGSAYKEGAAWYVYLIAAGPQAFWESANPAAAFWEAAEWSPSTSWLDYASSWKAWTTPTSGPVELPAGLKTHPVGRLPIHIWDGSSWEIRCSRVTTTPGPPWKAPAT